MIVVSAENTDKVQLVLDNAKITTSTSAAIYVLEADKVFITTASDSQNTLTNRGEYVAIDDNNIDAVITDSPAMTVCGLPMGHTRLHPEKTVSTRRTPMIPA